MLKIAVREDDTRVSLTHFAEKGSALSDVIPGCPSRMFPTWANYDLPKSGTPDFGVPGSHLAASFALAVGGGRSAIPTLGASGRMGPGHEARDDGGGSMYVRAYFGWSAQRPILSSLHWSLTLATVPKILMP